MNFGFLASLALTEHKL